jgi:hypothetical protein
MGVAESLRLGDDEGMDGGEQRLPPGHQPYDALNGLRVGGLAGALLGAVVTAVTTVGLVWLVPVGAVAGAAAGYLYQRGRTGS